MPTLTDNFNRPNTSPGSGLGSIPGGGPAWQVLSGNWHILDNHAKQDQDVSGIKVVVVETGDPNPDISLRTGPDSTPGIALRVSDASNFIAVGMGAYSSGGTATGYYLRASRVQAGVVTTIAEYAVSATHYEVARVEASGSLLTFYRSDGAVLGSVTEAFNETATRHGMAAERQVLTVQYYDDFTITYNGPPNAPTVSMPSTVAIGEPATVTLGFSDPDVGDSASWSGIRFRRTDIVQPWTTITRTSPVTTVTIPAATTATMAEAQYELQGANRDAQGLPENDADLVWSPSVFFTAHVRPAGPVFTDPVTGETITTQDRTFTVSIPALDALEWRVLADLAGAPDESTVIDSGRIENHTARSFTARDLPNGQTVHPQARAQDGGLYSEWSGITNLVSYTPPAVPTVELFTDSTAGTLAVSVTNPVPVGDEPAVTHNQLRIRPVGAATPGFLRDPATDEAQIITPSGTFTWYAPASGTDYEVQVVAFGDNGTSSSSEWTGAASVVDPSNTYGGSYS